MQVALPAISTNMLGMIGGAVGDIMFDEATGHKEDDSSPTLDSEYAVLFPSRSMTMYLCLSPSIPPCLPLPLPLHTHEHTRDLG